MLVWALWIEDSLRWQVAGGLLKNQTVPEGGRIARGMKCVVFFWEMSWNEGQGDSLDSGSLL